MLVKILRGASMGVVLGFLIGIGMGGIIHIFKGGNSELVEDVKNTTEIERSYNTKEVRAVLGDAGITGLAQFVAQDNWEGEVPEKEEASEKSTEASEEELVVNAMALEDSLLRFHIRANSNSDTDLELKYMVRDAVIKEFDEELTKFETKDEAVDFLYSHLDEIEKLSLDTLSEEGFNYSVKVYITNDYFPIRQYGEMVLPAGYYEALRIDIGLAEGENFWCILYPMMCYPIEAGAVVSKGEQEQLKKELTKEQYDKLFIEKEVDKEDVEIRFKLIELIFG